MRKNLVMTLTGPDRVGLVDHITQLILEFDGNIEESRMARLGGEFSMLMLVTAPEAKFEALQKKLQDLRGEGFKVSTGQTDRGHAVKFAGWIPYRLTVNGADHEGIIYHLAHFLAEQGIHIEQMDTSMVRAPMSGTPLFVMSAIILVPPDLPQHGWRDELGDIGDKMNVDTDISPYAG